MTADRKKPFAPVTCIQEIWRLNEELTGSLTTRFYNMFRDHQPPNYDGIKLTWENDLGQTIDDETWTEVVQSWYSVARDMQARLICFKILNRSYWTPSKMARLGLREDRNCWRCNKEIGTLLHMLYECEMVHGFWSTVIRHVNDIMETNFTMNPALCVLGILNVPLSSQKNAWVTLALITGCRIVLRHWKSKERITIKEWKDEIARVASFEQLIHKINNSLHVFQKVWGPYIRSIGS